MITAIFFFAFITLGLGLPLVLLVTPKANRFIQAGLANLVGVGIFTLIMFVSNLLGLKFSLVNEFLLLGLFSIPLVFVQKRNLKNFFVEISKKQKLSKLDKVEKVILGIILFLIISSFINTLYWPVYMWDAVVLYDFRGHVFADTGFMKDALTNEYYYSYPLLTSLSHAIVYLAGGAYPQFIYSGFYLSFAVGFYGLLSEFVSRKSGLFFTLVLLLVQPIFYNSLFSYTNLIYTIYLSLGALLIYLWDKKSLDGKREALGYLILSGVLVGLSTWVRAAEPFWIGSIAIVLLVSLFRKRFVSPFIYFLLVYPIIKTWKVFQSAVAGGEILAAGQGDNYAKIWTSLMDFSNWAKIFEYLYKNVVIPWGPLFILFVFMMIFMIFKKKIKDYFLIFFIPLIFIVLLIAGIFIFSVYLDYWYRIGDATQRLSMLFYPFFVYAIALVISSSMKDN